MNKNHRSIWNTSTQSWVAVAENTAAKGKKNKIKSINKSTVQLHHFSVSKVLQASTLALTALFGSYATAADCRDGVGHPAVPTVSDDNFNCYGGEISSWNGLGGYDWLTISNNNADLSITGLIQFGNDNDYVQIYPQAYNTLTSTATASYEMGAGNDLIHLGSSTAGWNFYSTANLGSGNDNFSVTDKVNFAGTVNAGDGNDDISLGAWKGGGSGVTSFAETPVINGNIYGDAGDDTFSILENAIVNGTLSGGTGKDTFNLKKGSGKIINGDADNDSFILFGTFNFNDTNLILNGGDGIDNLLLNAVSGSVIATNINNFENIVLDNNSAVNFSGNQLTLQNDLDSGSNNAVEIKSGSQLSFSSNIFTISGGKGVINHGKLNLRSSAPGKNLIITGDYVGSAGSSILFNTRLGDDSSITDKLVILGNTTGSSNISVQNVGGTGAATVNGINLIEVQGNSSATFTLASPVQIGLYEYFLFKTAKNWNLSSVSSFTPEKAPTPTPSPTPTPTPSPTPSPTASASPSIYRPAVSGYLQAAQAQFDQTHYLIGGLEQRQAINLEHFNIWGRTFSNQSKNQTNTFEHKQSGQTLQFGKNTMRTDEVIDGNRTQTNAGVTASIGQQAADYFDNQRAFTRTGTFTGQSYTNDFGLGVYYTRRNEVTPYIDLQALVMSNRTEFTDIYDLSAKQNGIGVALSAEMGKTMALGATDLSFTPQAQIIYQAMTYDGLNDSISDVGKQDAQSMRARVGVTFQSNKVKTAQSKTDWSASLNLWQELIESPTRTIADQVVRPENNSKPWLELGVGVNHQLDEASSLNAQVSYKHSLTGKQYTGNALNITYNLNW